MKKYTQIKAANKVIEEQLKQIKEEILRSVADVSSIILSGGFSRGEGSVLFKDGKYYPVNDYDIYVVTKKEPKEEVLNNISDRMMKKFGFKPFSFYTTDLTMLDKFYIDIRSLTKKKLRNLIPLVKYYELKHTGKILYGENALKLMPDFKVEDIPLSDGFRFILNRMAGIIEYFTVDYLHRKMRDYERKTVFYFCSKIYLESCVALLLLTRKFKPTYLERAVIFKKTYKKDYPELADKLPDLVNKVEKFTNAKLKSSFPRFDPVKLWFESKSDAIEILKYYLKEAFRIKVNNVYELSNEIYKKIGDMYYEEYVTYTLKKNRAMEVTPFIVKLLKIYLSMLYFLRILNFKKKIYFNTLFSGSPDMKIYAAAPLILESLNKDGTVNKRMIKKAEKYIKKIYPVQRIEQDGREYWENIKKTFGTAYRLYAFQKLI